MAEESIPSVWESVVLGKLDGLRNCLTMPYIPEVQKEEIRIEIRTLEGVVQSVRDFQ